MAGLIKPMLDWPRVLACSLHSARKPAQRGVATLSPPTDSVWPLLLRTKTLSETIATSGMFLKVVEPPLVAPIMIGCCQHGIANLTLVPPLLAPLPPMLHQFQVVSET